MGGAGTNIWLPFLSPMVLMTPSGGVTPDFDNPRQNHWLQHYLVFGIGGPLALAFLCQRYYTKLYLSKGLQIDDGARRTGSVEMQSLTNFASIHVSGLDHVGSHTSHSHM